MLLICFQVSGNSTKRTQMVSTMMAMPQLPMTPWAFTRKPTSTLLIGANMPEVDELGEMMLPARALAKVTRSLGP